MYISTNSTYVQIVHCTIYNVHKNEVQLPYTQGTMYSVYNVLLHNIYHVFRYV